MAKPRRAQVRAQRAAALRAKQQREERRRTFIRWAVIGAALATVAAVIVVVAVTRKTSAPLGPESIPLQKGTLLASVSGAASGATVDGVQCQAREQVAYHIHAHVAVYVDGKLRPIPFGVGVVEPVAQQTARGPLAGATTCYYWLHTHAQDGIVHVESPAQVAYSLGNFFDIWRQPLSATQVGPATGTVTAYVDGKKYDGDVRTIGL